MKNLVSLLIISLITMACDSNQNTEIINPPDGVSFQIEKRNSTNNYITTTSSTSLEQKSSSWSKFQSNNLHHIQKSIQYDLTLTNGETIRFGLEFTKFDPNSDLLSLDGTGNSGLNWDYISSQTEGIDFYKNCNLSVHIGEYNVIWLGNTNDTNLVRVATVLVNGVEKSHITINFEGSARGYYGPNGEYQSFYDITNGVFRGIVE